MKVTLRNKQWVKRELHAPCVKVVKAAARFMRYREPRLRLAFSQAWLYAGRCLGERYFRIIPPKYQHEEDLLHNAASFFEVACHELAHCLDLIEDGAWLRGRAAERKVHDRLYDITGGTAKRYNTGQWAWEVKLPKYVEDAILELALVLEGLALAWRGTKEGKDWLRVVARHEVYNKALAKRNRILAAAERWGWTAEKGASPKRGIDWWHLTKRMGRRKRRKWLCFDWSGDEPSCYLIREMKDSRAGQHGGAALTPRKGEAT